MAKSPKLSFHAVTPERWPDIEKLFGERGACGGCWCMFWRIPRKQYETDKGLKNKRAFQNLVMAGAKPGIVGYLGDEPVAWCAVAPREQYIALERSRILKPVDEQLVWSLSCLFVQKGHRRQGIASKMLRGAVEFAAREGARIIEGYPVDPATNNMPDAFLWH